MSGNSKNDSEKTGSGNGQSEGAQPSQTGGGGNGQSEGMKQSKSGENESATARWLRSKIKWFTEILSVIGEYIPRQFFMAVVMWVVLVLGLLAGVFGGIFSWVDKYMNLEKRISAIEDQRAESNLPSFCSYLAEAAAISLLSGLDTHRVTGTEQESTRGQQKTGKSVLAPLETYHGIAHYADSNLNLVGSVFRSCVGRHKSFGLLDKFVFNNKGIIFGEKKETQKWVRFNQDRIEDLKEIIKSSRSDLSESGNSDHDAYTSAAAMAISSYLLLTQCVPAEDSDYPEYVSNIEFIKNEIPDLNQNCTLMASYYTGLVHQAKATEGPKVLNETIDQLMVWLRSTEVCTTNSGQLKSLNNWYSAASALLYEITINEDGDVTFYERGVQTIEPYALCTLYRLVGSDYLSSRFEIYAMNDNLTSITELERLASIYQFTGRNLMNEYCKHADLESEIFASAYQEEVCSVPPKVQVHMQRLEQKFYLLYNHLVKERKLGAVIDSQASLNPNFQGSELYKKAKNP